MARFTGDTELKVRRFVFLTGEPASVATEALPGLGDIGNPQLAAHGLSQFTLEEFKGLDVLVFGNELRGFRLQYEIAEPERIGCVVAIGTTRRAEILRRNVGGILSPTARDAQQQEPESPGSRRSPMPSLHAEVPVRLKHDNSRSSTTVIFTWGWMARKSITRGGTLSEGRNQIYEAEVTGNELGWGIGMGAIMEVTRDFFGCRECSVNTGQMPIPPPPPVQARRVPRQSGLIAYPPPIAGRKWISLVG